MADSNGTFFSTETVGSFPITRDVLPLQVQVDGSEVTDLILTNFDGGVSVNYSLNYAFNNDAYAFIFGNRLSTLRLSGYAFPESCDGVSSAPSAFLALYNKGKLGGSSNGVKFSFGGQGGVTGMGYFIGMNLELVGQTETTFRFTFSLLGTINDTTSV